MANEASSGGIGFFGLLGVCFIVLKLVHVINWSWWWVLLPLYGGLALLLAILLFALMCMGVAKLADR
jgi:hypothetical protein